jgi:uncharacterized membrane protein YbaN (DUF454 family)
MRGERSRAARAGWLAVAYLSAALALVGVVVPVLPTTPFALLAVVAAARGSERLHARLLAHPRLGSAIRAWRRDRAVARRAKQSATATMAVSAAILFLVAPSPWLAGAVTLVMACVGAWLWLRPEPPRP